jgi:hypothetical protein
VVALGTDLFGFAGLLLRDIFRAAGGSHELLVSRQHDSHPTEPMADLSAEVVYSRTLDSVSRVRTRLERDFDPDAVRRPGRVPCGVVYLRYRVA